MKPNASYEEELRQNIAECEAELAMARGQLRQAEHDVNTWRYQPADLDHAERRVDKAQEALETARGEWNAYLIDIGARRSYGARLLE